VAATKARPATDEPVKRTATKTLAKKAPPAKAGSPAGATKTANGTAPAKGAAKKAPAAKAAKAPATKSARPAKGEPATRGRAKKGTGPEAETTDTDIATDELESTEDVEVEPGEDLEETEIDLEDLEVGEETAEGAEPAAKTPAVVAPGPADAEDDIAEPSEKDKASGDFVWDEEESEALRQARKDAELTASADSVRAYLKQIGKVALLNAEEEVELAKRIEAGLYATQLMSEFAEKGEKLPAAQRRDMSWICRDGDWKRTCASSCRWPSATPAAGWRSSTSSRKATSA
jgi:RNA polymerase primary sigma factor